jgi:hypothetical protein
MAPLLPLFKWFDKTFVNRLINDSNWLFPAIEAVHIVALAMLLGAILILNLRILGLTLNTKPPALLHAELAPWTFWSLVTILTTGLLLFTSEAVKSSLSGPFRIKMVLLALAIALHYTVQRRLLQPGSDARPLWRKLTAMVAIVLWFGVGFAGRAIGFF